MAMQLQSGFEIAKFSNLEYEDMAVEIRYKGVPVAELNRHNGKHMQEIEIPSRFSPDGEQFKFPLGDFIQALEEARKLLAALE